MTPQDHARRAATEAPTPAEVRRVTNAMLAKPPHCYASGDYRGWRYAVHDSPFTSGMLLVSIVRVDVPGKSEEVATLDAARDWLRGNAT